MENEGKWLRYYQISRPHMVSNSMRGKSNVSFIVSIVAFVTPLQPWAKVKVTYSLQFAASIHYPSVNYCMCIKVATCWYMAATIQFPWIEKSPGRVCVGLGNACVSPWPMAEHNHHQNSIHGKPHKKKPAPPFKYPKPIFTDKFRLNMEFGKRV